MTDDFDGPLAQEIVADIVRTMPAGAQQCFQLAQAIEGFLRPMIDPDTRIDNGAGSAPEIGPVADSWVCIGGIEFHVRVTISQTAEQLAASREARGATRQ